jgi:hypothetical protein
MRYLLSLLFLASSTSLAQVQVVARVTPINAASAFAADITSSAITTDGARTGSLHCKWASIGGTPNATFAFEVSNDAGVSWVTKPSTTITMSGTSGQDLISLDSNKVTESLYRVKYTKTGVTTTGSVSCFVLFKD